MGVLVKAYASVIQGGGQVPASAGSKTWQLRHLLLDLESRKIQKESGYGIVLQLRNATEVGCCQERPCMGAQRGCYVKL